MKKAAIFHTNVGTLEVMRNLTKDIMPDVDIMHIVEDSMIRDVMKNGGPTPAINSRIESYIQCAQKAGCDIFMTACSSIGGSVEQCQFVSSIPVMRIDEAMANEAVRIGTKIAVLATVETTLRPTLEFIERKAGQSGKSINIISHLMADAFTAFLAGELTTHDTLVSAGLWEMVGKRCDVIVLAQASMARVLETIKVLPVSVLTSPESGIRLLKDRIDRLG